MQVRIIKPGLLSTIQDLGRMAFLPDAVPRSGAMDSLACRIANIVLGNNENDAVIEFTYHGAELYAETDLLIAFSGEGATLTSNGIRIPNDRPVFAPAGTHLKLEQGTGCRSYLSISGGWDVPIVLGSRSTFLTAGFGGFHGRTLKEKDVLRNIPQENKQCRSLFNSLKSDTISFPSWSAPKEKFLSGIKNNVRVIPGKEFTRFSAESLIAFLSEPFAAGLRSNRMAYQLEGPPIIKNKFDELISTAVCPGTIQVSGDGKLMLLMADCQTTGGYPRIGQVIVCDLPVCAQLKPGDQIFFEEISRRQAEKLYLQQEQNLKELKAAVSWRI